MSAPRCYCGSAMRLRDGKWGKFWSCTQWPQCDGAVGCHPGTTTPLGTVAPKAVRQARMRAHAAFDPLWEDHDDVSRGLAYRWLALRLGVDQSDCHMGEFDLETCERVVALCEGQTPETIREYVDSTEVPA